MLSLKNSKTVEDLNFENNFTDQNKQPQTIENLPAFEIRNAPKNRQTESEKTTSD